MWKLLALLAVIAAATARPASDVPATATRTHTAKPQVVEYVKQVEHLSEEEVFDLEEQGEKMIAEINEKKIVLEGKAKQQLEDLLDLAKVLKADSDERAAQFRKEAEDIKSKELPFDFNKGCTNDEDCTEGTFCYPVDKALQTVLQAFGDIEEYELIAKKAKISGNECVPKFSKETIFFELGNILSLFNEKKEKIVQKIESKKRGTGTEGRQHKFNRCHSLSI